MTGHAEPFSVVGCPRCGAPADAVRLRVPALVHAVECYDQDDAPYVGVGRLVQLDETPTEAICNECDWYGEPEQLVRKDDGC